MFNLRRHEPRRCVRGDGNASPFWLDPPDEPAALEAVDEAGLVESVVEVYCWRGWVALARAVENEGPRPGTGPAPDATPPLRQVDTVIFADRERRGDLVPVVADQSRARLAQRYLELSQYYLARNLVAAPRRRRLRRALPCGQPSSFTHALPLYQSVPLYGA